MQRIVNRRGRCLGLLFILCISAGLLSPIYFSNLGFKKNLDTDDYRIVILPKHLDINANKIHDSFESGLDFASLENIEAIVSFTQAPTQDDRDFIKSLGGQIITEYQIIFAAHILIPAIRLHELAKYYTVSSISANSRSSSSLYISNYQVRARNAAWLQQYNGLNLTGSEYFSTAVLDSGIDANHPDLASRVIAWQDFIGASANITGDEYATATDYGHHGTHVAGIIAGQGNSSKDGYIDISSAGVIPANTTVRWPGPAFYKYNSDPRSLIIKQSWDLPVNLSVGYYYDGIYYSSRIHPNEQVSFQIIQNGQYNTVIGETYLHSIPFDTPYVAQVCMPDTNPTGDIYGGIAGIAPTSKIVALKVLDDTGSGTKASLLDAFDWCSTNKAIYNITVINLSFEFETIESDVDTAIANLVTNHGIVVVAAAGNKGVNATRIGSPGSAPHAITVGAVNRLSEIAIYSSVGNPIDNNIVVKPDITAPGGSYISWEYPNASLQDECGIFAIDSNYDDPFFLHFGPIGWMDNKSPQDRYPNDYTYMQGTSMAAPHVSAIAQLVIQRLAGDNGGNWTWSGANALKVKQILLMATSESGALYNRGEGDQNPLLNRGIKDYTEGWGRVDALSAINLATNPITSFKYKEFHFSTQIGASRIEGLNLHLIQNKEYDFKLRIEDSNSDVDLFLYQANPSEYGEPVEIRRSANIGRGVGENITFTPETTGNYYLIVRWSEGNLNSRAALYDLNVNEALDNDDLNFMVLGIGLEPWVPQTVTTHDGVDAMKSYRVWDGYESEIRTTIAGPGKLSFWWKVSSQPNSDYFIFKLNYYNVYMQSGEVDWSYYEYDLGYGVYNVSWSYRKDNSGSYGYDTAWLDEVSFLPGVGFNTTIYDITPNPSLNGTINLNWKNIPGASRYYIYRSTSSFSDVSGLTPIAETGALYYQDRLYDNGTYYYRVVATNGTLNSSISNEVSVNVEITPTIGEQTVTISDIEPNPSPHGIISLDWNDIVGANKYYVYRRTSSFNTVAGLTPIAEPTTSSYQDTLTTNGTYYYRIIATNGTHNTSLSNQVSVVVQIQPTMNNQEVIVSNIVPNPSTTGQITVDWNDIIGATKYYVYRSTTNFNNVSGLTPIAEPSISLYSDSLTVNGTYYYRIIATNGTHNTSLSNQVTVIASIEPTMENQAVVIPEILPNPSTNGEITLDWNDIIGATKYYVYRDTNSIYSLLGLTPIAELSTSAYLDTLTNGTYYYRIIATNGTHNSSLSNEVSVVVQIQPTMDNQPVIISNILPNPSTNGRITIDWNDITGASKYYLYRHTSSFSNVAGLTPIAEIYSSAYFDTLTESGTYYYRIIATNGSHNTSLSNEVSVVVQIQITMEDQEVVLSNILPNPSTNGNITLDWNDITGATKYYVYRHTSSFSNVIGLTPISEPVSSAYLDTITANGTYYYRIIATNGTHNTSLSNEKSVVVQIPPPIEGETVIISDILPNPSMNGKITMDWNDIEGATKYYVYRHTTSFSDVSGLTPIAEVTISFYKDTITTNGTYYYRVIATNGPLNSSVSNEVSVTVQIEQSSFEYNEIFLIAYTTNGKNVILKWSEVLGATKYYIFMQESEFSDVSGLTPFAEVSGDQFSHVASKNGTFYYRIIATNGISNTTVSNIANVTAATPPSVVDPDPADGDNDEDPDDEPDPGDGQTNDTIEIPVDFIKYGAIGIGIAAVILVVILKKKKR